MYTVYAIRDVDKFRIRRILFDKRVFRNKQFSVNFYQFN